MAYQKLNNRGKSEPVLGGGKGGGQQNTKGGGPGRGRKDTIWTGRS